MHSNLRLSLLKALNSTRWSRLASVARSLARSFSFSFSFSLSPAREDGSVSVFLLLPEAQQRGSCLFILFRISAMLVGSSFSPSRLGKQAGFRDLTRCAGPDLRGLTAARLN